MSNFAWLIEAPGPRYLAPRKINNMYDFVWTQDHNLALQFKDEAQADLTMMAIRALAPALFGFEVTLGNARPAEHGWMEAGNAELTKENSHAK
jgi:hypothetical protein